MKNRVDEQMRRNWRFFFEPVQLSIIEELRIDALARPCFNLTLAGMFVRYFSKPHAALLHRSSLASRFQSYFVFGSEGRKFKVFGDTNDAAGWTVKIASNRVYSEIVATA